MAGRQQRARAVKLVARICQTAGNPRLIADTRRRLKRRGVLAAIQRHDSRVLFEWMAETFSFQGIADSVAYDYLQRHGGARWENFAASLPAKPSCPKLRSYWHFEGCGYRKAAQRCNEPQSYPSCPLPRHDFRNGNLNQSAYSLFLFIRDVADGDLVTWIDARLDRIDLSVQETRAAEVKAALIDPIGEIAGIVLVKAFSRAGRLIFRQRRIVTLRADGCRRMVRGG
jgi:hypothetical protein